MAEMALGYGSEFELLRFLGHHREDLDMLVQNATGQFGQVKWLDYPYDKVRKSGDGELTGIECFQSLPFYQEIVDKWAGYWPQGGSSMNWDGIFTIDGTWYFVEAKANEREAYQLCQAKDPTSKQMIDTAMNFAKEWLGITNDIIWRRTNCYQLANRLAFAAFCNSNHIKAKILYVSFLNGFGKGSIKSVEAWKQIWENEYKTLGITESDLAGIVYHIYPDCMQ